MKNCKTLYEAQTASRIKETIQPPPNPPPSDKTYCAFQTKIFLQRYTEAHRHLLLKCFKNTVLGRQEKVQ